MQELKGLVTSQNYTSMYNNHRKHQKIKRECDITAITKPQDMTPPNPTMKQLGPHPGQKLIIICHNCQIMTHITYEIHISPHAYVNQQSSDQTSFYFNQSIVE